MLHAPFAATEQGRSHRSRIGNGTNILARTDLTTKQRRPIQLLEIDLLRSQWDNNGMLNKLSVLHPVKTAPIESNQGTTVTIELSPFKRKVERHESKETLQKNYDRLCKVKQWEKAIDVAVLLFPLQSVQEQRHLLRQSIDQLLSIGHLKRR